MRGLKWAVKQFEAALPRLDAEARDLFTKMRDSHLRSIAACEALAAQAAAGMSLSAAADWLSSIQ